MELNKHWYSDLPKWLKAILLIISLITMVYWAGFMIYKILCGIRVIGAFIFEKRNYWTFLGCILILGIGALLLAQFYFGLQPFENFIAWIENLWDQLRNWVSELIKG